MYKTMQTSSWTAFRNHCEYACPLDIQRKSYTKERVVALVLMCLATLVWAFFS